MCRRWGISLLFDMPKIFIWKCPESIGNILDLFLWIFSTVLCIIWRLCFLLDFLDLVGCIACKFISFCLLQFWYEWGLVEFCSDAWDEGSLVDTHYSVDFRQLYLQMLHFKLFVRRWGRDSNRISISSALLGIPTVHIFIFSKNLTILRPRIQKSASDILLLVL